MALNVYIYYCRTLIDRRAPREIPRVCNTRLSHLQITRRKASRTCGTPLRERGRNICLCLSISPGYTLILLSHVVQGQQRSIEIKERQWISDRIGKDAHFLKVALCADHKRMRVVYFQTMEWHLNNRSHLFHAVLFLVHGRNCISSWWNLITFW